MDDVDWNNKFVFVIARNPYARLVSGWQNRLHEMKKIMNQELLGLSFDKFVREKSKISDNNIDHHFRSQYWFVDGIDLDYIGRIETFQEDWDFLSKKFNIERKELVHEKKSKHKNYRSYYNDTLRELVYKRYEKDFEFFGYDKKL